MEFPDCRDRPNHDGIGIDLGIKDLAICSDGNTYKNINKNQTVKKLRNASVDYNATYHVNMNTIRKEEVTVKLTI